MMAGTGFAARHYSDRLFFLVFVIVAWLAIYFGFSPSIAARFAGRSDYPAPLILEVHVWSFFGWMVLLTVQIALVRLNRIDLHRLLGTGLLVLVPVMAVSGIAAEVHSQRFYAAQNPENARFFIIPLASIIMFVASAGAAAGFALRGHTSAHKRLILIATAIILMAAFGRWWNPVIEPLVGTRFWGVMLGNFLGTDLMIGAAMLHDRATRGLVHEVYMVAAPLILLIQMAIGVIYFLPGWPDMVRTMLGI